MRDNITVSAMYFCRKKVVISAFDHNCIPLTNRSCVAYGAQRTATGESAALDACHAIRYLYACKAVAAREGAPADARYTVGYRHAFKAATFAEHFVFDSRCAA